MDRDTVRLILIVAGVFLLAGIYLWGRYKPALLDWLAGRRRPEPSSLDEAEEIEEPDPYRDEIRAEGVTRRKEPHLSGLDVTDNEAYELEPIPEIGETAGPDTPAQAVPDDATDSAPFLIQVSVVAGPGRHFQGPELKQALLDVDLLYGDMGIFHRYDPDLTVTQFSVASLVEPGTFPIDDMTHFTCPGIILFFQTARATDPLSIYDDLVNTSRELAHRLHGIQWDEARQPLSASKIAHMRNLLKHRHHPAET